MFSRHIQHLKKIFHEFIGAKWQSRALPPHLSWSSFSHSSTVERNDDQTGFPPHCSALRTCCLYASAARKAFKEIIRFFTTHGELVVNNRETARAWWVPLIKVRSFDHSTCALSFDSLSKVLFIFRSLYLCAITLLVRYHHHQWFPTAIYKFQIISSIYEHP